MCVLYAIRHVSWYSRIAAISRRLYKAVTCWQPLCGVLRFTSMCVFGSVFSDDSTLFHRSEAPHAGGHPMMEEQGI
jgi:hypothetical protein